MLGWLWGVLMCAGWVLADQNFDRQVSGVRRLSVMLLVGGAWFGSDLLHKSLLFLL